MSADGETAALAATYLLWFVPAMALQFLMVAMGSALRAVGNFKPHLYLGSTARTEPTVRFRTARPAGVLGLGTPAIAQVQVTPPAERSGVQVTPPPQRSG